MPRALTDRQAQCLDVIRGSLQRRGYPPTLREIGIAMCITSTNGVNDHLIALERKGFVRREEMRSRAIRLVDRNDELPPEKRYFHDATPGVFRPRMRCLRCGAVTFIDACSVCRSGLLEIVP